MHRDKRFGAVIERKGLSANLRNDDRTSEHAARGGRTKSNDDCRLHNRALQILPPAAPLDLKGIRPLVQSPLATDFVFKMLDSVGEKNSLALDPGFFERPIQDTAGGTNKRHTCLVLLVAWLFANQHHGCSPQSLPWHRLGSMLVERTASACVLGQA